MEHRSTKHTATYIPISSGYMGQLLDWPEADADLLGAAAYGKGCQTEQSQTGDQDGDKSARQDDLLPTLILRQSMQESGSP